MLLNIHIFSLVKVIHFLTILSTTENSPIKVHVYLKVDTNSRRTLSILSDFSLTVKAAPHECVIRTGQP